MGSQDDELIILHLSDLHFGKYNPYGVSFSRFKSLWSRITGELNRKSLKLEDIDLIVVTGDIGSEGINTDYTVANRFFKEIIFPLFPSKPVLLIPGNHDLKWTTPGDCNPQRFYEYIQFKRDLNLLREPADSVDYLSNPHFFASPPLSIIVCLNSCLYTSYKLDQNYPTDFSQSRFNPDRRDDAAINEDQLVSIMANIQSLANLDNCKFKIALLHHNILPTETHRAFLTNYERMIDILKRFEFKLLLHGHLHSENFPHYEGTLAIGAGSLGVGSNDMDTKNSLNVIRLTRDYNLFGSSYPITVVYVLTIDIDYTQSDEYAVSTRDSASLLDGWRRESVEIETSEFDRMLEVTQNQIQSITEGKMLATLESTRELKNMILKTYLTNKTGLSEGMCRNFEHLLTEKIDSNLDYFLGILEKEFHEKPSVSKDLLNYLPKKYQENPIIKKILETPSITSPRAGGPRARYFAWRPLRSLMASVGAKIVARDAVSYLLDWLEAKTIDMTQRAQTFARHAKHKKITKSDINRVIK